MHGCDNKLRFKRCELPANRGNIFVPQDSQQNNGLLFPINLSPCLDESGGGGFVVSAVQNERHTRRASDPLKTPRPNDMRQSLPNGGLRNGHARCIQRRESQRGVELLVTPG